MSKPKPKPPAFQFYASDFLTSTAEMTHEEVGMYIRLLCHQWVNGSVNKSRAHRILHCKIPNEVLERFVEKDGELRNARLEHERAKQAAYKEKQAASGRDGADKRWGKGRYGDTISDPIATPLADNVESPSNCQWQNDSSSSSSSHSSPASPFFSEKGSVDASRQTPDGTPSASDGLLFQEEDHDRLSKEKNQSGAEHRSAQVDDWKLRDYEIETGEAETAARSEAVSIKRDPMRATPEFDPWMVEFRRVWNATPGTTKLTGRLSHSVKEAIWARRADPWFLDNWRKALAMFPLPYFQKVGQLIGITKFFTEPNFIENVIEGKWQIDHAAAFSQPKVDRKTAEVGTMFSDLHGILSGEPIEITPLKKVITHG